jgi:alpha-L-arabinofuranosidase
VANTSNFDQSLAVRFNGLDGITSARQILLHSDDLDADNTLDEPEKIVPEETNISAKGDVLNVTLKAKTFAVYIVKK